MGTHVDLASREPAVLDLVIYGDFNCPFSALASQRAERLEAAGIARVDWRAVEHDPDIALEGDALVGAPADEADREIEQVQGLLLPDEVLELRRRHLRSNTRIAVEIYAGTEPRDRSALRARLFEWYWSRGRDLGATELFAELGDTDRAPDTASRWRREWLEIERPIVPAMRLPDGRVSRGLGALTRLGDLAAPRREDA